MVMMMMTILYITKHVVPARSCILEVVLLQKSSSLSISIRGARLRAHEGTRALWVQGHGHLEGGGGPHGGRGGECEDGVKGGCTFTL